MKKMMLGALCLVPCVVRAAALVQIGDLFYGLNDSAMTALVAPSSLNDITDVVIPASVTYGDKSYAVTSIAQGAFQNCTAIKSFSAPSVTSIGDGAFEGCTAIKSFSAQSVTSIGERAFSGCSSLESFFAPSVTSIGEGAFSSCGSLASLAVNSAMQPDWDSKRSFYGISPLTRPMVTFVTTPTLKREEVEQAGWKAETAVTVVSTAVKIGDTTLDKDEYENACKYYGITPKTEPTAEDFKAVPKDAQVVKEGEIAVTKESLQAAKAETVEIVGGMVYLGVSVLSNSDITTSTAWTPVKFTEDTQIGLSADGTKLVLPIPVAAQQGFMILQSGDAKAVPSDIMTDGSITWNPGVIKPNEMPGIKEVNSETLTIVGFSVDAANGSVLLKVGAETTANGDPMVANFLNVTVRKGAEVTVKVEHAESPAGPWTELQGVGGTVTVDSAGADIEVKLTGELPAQGYFRAKVEE